jgi:hypothetical protein
VAGCGLPPTKERVIMSSSNAVDREHEPGVGGLEAWPEGLRFRLTRALALLGLILGVLVLADALS